MSDEIPRGWNDEWNALERTIDDELGLLTEKVKLKYLLPRLAGTGGRCLEVGCGSAKLLALLAKRDFASIGLDLSPEALRVAANNFRHLGVKGHFLRGEGTTLPFRDGQFDLVISTGLLEHFRRPLPIVAEMVRVLRPGGLLFSDVVPLKFSLMRSVWYLRGLHRGVTDEFPYNGEDIRGWLTAAGLVNVSVFPSCVAFPPGFIGRIPGVRGLVARAGPGLWTAVDGTLLAEWLGFFYLAFGVKPGEEPEEARSVVPPVGLDLSPEALRVAGSDN